MKYQSGNAGRIFITRFEDGEDPLKELTEFARKEEY